MYICEICKKNCANIQSLSTHIGRRHKDVDKQEYYFNYLRENDNYICPVCGKITPFLGFRCGFQKHCSAKCAGTDKNTKLKRENTNATRFGAKYNFQTEEFRQLSAQHKLEKYGDANYNNRDLYKKNNLVKYGVENTSQLKEIQEKIIQTSLQRYNTSRPQKSDVVKNKTKQTCIDKYGTSSYYQTSEFKEKSKQTKLIRHNNEYYNNPNKRKQTCLKRYGVKTVLVLPEVMAKANSKEAIDKMNDTKRKNKTFNVSRQEDTLYNNLVTIFNKNNVKRQYKSDLYPFACDFYIEPLDMYIELNLHWTHGGHFFDKTSDADLQILAKWKEKAKKSKYFRVALNVWTKLDLIKRDTAKKNNLNYITLWNTNEVNKFLDKLYKSL